MDEHKNIPAGVYNIKFYDEEGYADLRKVLLLPHLPSNFDLVSPNSKYR